MSFFTSFKNYKLVSLLFASLLIVGAFAIKNQIKHKKYQLLFLSKMIPNSTGISLIDEDGVEIFLDVKDRVIAGTIIKHGSWEPHFRNLLRQLVKPRQQVIVLGSHVGVHTMLISRLLGENGKIHAFEPNPNTLKYLKTNILLNPIKNITLYEKAVSDQNAELKFVVVPRDKNAGASHLIRDDKDFIGEEITVESVRLDTVLPIPDGGFDIIQMDIEGAEAKAIFGAQNIIDHSPNLIVLQEWTPKWMKEDVDRYLKFWRERGYKFAAIHADSLVELSDDDLKNSTQIDIIIAKNLASIMASFKPLVK